MTENFFRKSPEFTAAAESSRDISTDLNTHERLLRRSLYRALLKAAEQELNENRSRLRVLDAGSGRGELLKLLAERNHEVTGLDPDAECVRLGSQYGTCVRGTFEDIRNLFTAGQFEVVVSSHVLEHVPNPIDALKALRHLNAGRYVFAVPNVHRSARLIRLLAGSARADHPNHIYGWGRPEFEAALRIAGFRITHWHTDRVTVNPFGGTGGAVFTRLLAPLEERLLPRLFPLFSSSLIVSCEIKK